MITILAVDDNPYEVELLERTLEETGIDCHLITARNGIEAQELLKSFSPRGPQDLVIFSDVNMPRQGGLEFLKWLQEEPRFQRYPVVMMSSFDNRREMSRAFELGALACMIKPPDPLAIRGLLQTIRRIAGAGSSSMGMTSAEVPAGLVNQFRQSS